MTAFWHQIIQHLGDPAYLTLFSVFAAFFIHVLSTWKQIASVKDKFQKKIDSIQEDRNIEKAVNAENLAELQIRLTKIESLIEERLKPDISKFDKYVYEISDLQKELAVIQAKNDIGAN